MANKSLIGLVLMIVISDTVFFFQREQYHKGLCLGPLGLAKFCVTKPFCLLKFCIMFFLHRIRLRQKKIIPCLYMSLTFENKISHPMVISKH